MALFQAHDVTMQQDPLFSLPGHLIRRMQQIAVSAFAAEVEAAGHDLTPVQFAVLQVLSDHPGVDQATLAGLIAHDKVTIGGVIARLEARGHLTRGVSASDRRARTLEITDQGRRLLAEVAEPVRRAQDEMLAGLTVEERQTFIGLLQKATDAANHLSRAPLRLPESEGR